MVLLGLILFGEHVVKCGFERRLQLCDLSGDRSINSPCIVGKRAQLIVGAPADENEIQGGGESTNEWTCKWIMIPREEETGFKEDRVQRPAANAGGVSFKGGTWRRMREIC